MAIGTNPSGGTLSGTKTRTAVSGVASFNDLSIDKDGKTYTLKASSAGLSDVTSSVFRIMNGNEATWVGSLSTDWGTAGNWDIGVVPGSGYDIFIDPATFNPTLDMTRTANDLTINTSGVTNIGSRTLTLTGDLINSGTLNVTTGAINVAGNWANSGTFTAGTGTVTFDGIGASIFTGSTTFYNLTCATAGKTLTFTRGTEQVVTHGLTITGTVANPVVINDTGAGALPKLTVTAGATQSITLSLIHI